MLLLSRSSLIIIIIIVRDRVSGRTLDIYERITRIGNVHVQRPWNAYLKLSGEDKLRSDVTDQVKRQRILGFWDIKLEI